MMRAEFIGSVDFFASLTRLGGTLNQIIDSSALGNFANSKGIFSFIFQPFCFIEFFVEFSFIINSFVCTVDKLLPPRANSVVLERFITKKVEHRNVATDEKLFCNFRLYFEIMFFFNYVVFLR